MPRSARFAPRIRWSTRRRRRADRAAMAGIQVDERMPERRRAADAVRRAGSSRQQGLDRGAGRGPRGRGGRRRVPPHEGRRRQQRHVGRDRAVGRSPARDPGQDRRRDREVQRGPRRPSRTTSSRSTTSGSSSSRRTRPPPPRRTTARSSSIDPAYAPGALQPRDHRGRPGRRPPTRSTLYRRATDADPTFAKAFLNLGLLLFDTGDKTGSAAALDEGRAARPDPAQPHPAPTSDPPPSSGRDEGARRAPSSRSRRSLGSDAADQRTP